MSEEKSCRNCKHSMKNNDTGEVCRYAKYDCGPLLEKFTPIKKPPTEMQLLALDSINNGTKVWGQDKFCTTKGVVTSFIKGMGYFIESGNRKASFKAPFKEIFSEKPQTWKDMTREEVFQHCLDKPDEKVWGWDVNNGNIINLQKRQLCGYYHNHKPYKYGFNDGTRQHASLTKPE